MFRPVCKKRRWSRLSYGVTGVFDIDFSRVCRLESNRLVNTSTNEKPFLCLRRRKGFLAKIGESATFDFSRPLLESAFKLIQVRVAGFFQDFSSL